jgi:enoyl-CoA hydratase
MFNSLALSADGPIATLEFRRADDKNAFDESLHAEFAKAVVQLRQSPGIRVVLLHAAGRVFSAGGGLDYIERLRADPELRRRTHQEAHDIFSSLVEMPVPIVVAVQGHAVGFGATIVSACDVSVAWRQAKIGDPHIQIGLVAGDGGVLGWSAAVGYNRARRMLLTGDSVTAEQAYGFGLITDLVDTPEAALPEARRIAEQIAALPPVAVQGTKKTFNALARLSMGNVLDVSLMAEMHSLMSEDIEEALRAAKERRLGRYNNL